jgi:NAD(P)-dependent dehydrogenase (short-subunit alcohol dehydrogenase family)
MARELDGKVAIVTGGAKGLGRGTVEVFVEEGAKVVIADVDEAGGTELARRLGNSVRFKRTDVARREDVQALVDFATGEFGGLHIMFNNAATSDFAYGRLLDDDFRHFDEVMHVNVLGVMLGTQVAARHMVKNGGGSIVNTSSIGGIKAGGGLPVYRTSKAGIIHYTRSAAVDLGNTWCA